MFYHCVFTARFSVRTGANGECTYIGADQHSPSENHFSGSRTSRFVQKSSTFKRNRKARKKNKIVSHPLRTQRKKHVVLNASQYITTADISHKYWRYAANNKRKRKLSHLDGLHASADARKFRTNKKRLINGIKIDSSNDWHRTVIKVSDLK